MNHREQQQKCANQHHDALHGVIEHAGTESAKSGVERNSAAKNQQTGIIRNACGGFEQPRTANKLHRHGTDKGNQQTQTRQPDQQRALIAGVEHVIQRHRIMFTRQNGKLFP